MSSRVLICFPTSDALGLRAEAAQLALGLAAQGDEVITLGASGPWRHPLRAARVHTADLPWPCEERRLLRALQDYDPTIVHAFGAYIAHAVLPLTVLVGAGGVATLGHDDLARLNPAQFRTAAAVFVPCEYLREQIVRRLPATPVITTGYLLSPDDGAYLPRNRFLADELGVEEDAPVVLLADRFNGSEADVARALIEAMPLLDERLPELQAVIVGEGLRLSELEGLALEVNEALGRRAVLLPGYREDIRQLLSLATIAIGSGRFAMEAIGAGVALVAAGAAGMLGTYTPDNARLATYSCCGKHGRLEPVTPRALASEVIGLFSYPQYRERFAAEDQAAVLAYAERGKRTAQIATYYTRTAPTGVLTRTPQHMTVVLPDDLRELLFTLPAVAALRAHYPLANIRLLASRYHRRLMERMNLAQGVLEKPWHWRAWPHFLRGLSHPRPEATLVFADSLVDHLLTAVSLAPHRIGAADHKGVIAFSEPVHTREPISPGRALSLTYPLGITAPEAVPAPSLPAEMREVMDLGLLSLGIEPHEEFILLCPPADDTRAWQPSAWEMLVNLLQTDRPERVVILDEYGVTLPGRQESPMTIQDSLVLAALLARAALVIAPDDGPLHLADLLGVPTIGLYGPTSPEVCRLPNAQSAPLCHHEYSCHPCNGRLCPERRCLRALTAAEVASAVDRLLDAPPLTIAATG